MISFNDIPSNLRVPLFYAEFDNSRANQGGAVQEYRTLLMGIQLSTATVAAKTLQRVTSASQAAEMFGQGSVIAEMAAAFLAINKNNPLYCIGIAEPSGGAKAAGSITVAGTPTEEGTIALYVAGRRIEVGVATTDAAEDIAANIVTAVDADADNLLDAAIDGVTAEKANLTFRHKGVLGNEAVISHSHAEGEALPAGVTLTIVQPTGGTSQPDVAEFWPVLGDEQFLLMVSPFCDTTSIGAMETELADRFGPLKQNDGYHIVGKRGTHSALTTFGDGRNSKFVSVIGVRGPSSPWVWAAEIAARVAASASIDPARPFQTLPLNVYAPIVSERFTLEERNQLLTGGIATFMVDASGAVAIEGLITTYQTNAYGSPDTSYLYLNTLLTLSYLRFDLKARITSKYPRHKLASDGTRYAAGQKVVTPNVIKAELFSKFREWENKALVEGFDQFKDDLIVERNADNPNRLDVLMSPDLVNQLRVMGVQIQFLL